MSHDETSPAAEGQPAAKQGGEFALDSPRTRLPWRELAVLLVVVAVLSAAWRIYQWRTEPRFFFLDHADGAEWICADRPFLLLTQTTGQDQLETVFETWFSTAQPVEAARIQLRAFRRCAVVLDDQVVYEGPAAWDDWRQPIDIALSQPLGAGSHHLLVVTRNVGAWPCLWLRSDQLELHTGPKWSASIDRSVFHPAINVTKRRMPFWADYYPSVREALHSIAPWLAAIFVVVAAWSFWNSRPSSMAASLPRVRISARQVRWTLILGWFVLAANNFWQLPPELGYDVWHHLDYLKFIAEHRSLPLATDGWQMFQSPLVYVLATPWYAALSPYLDDAGMVRSLRFIPLLCGLAQIEIAYRAARMVFPDNNDQQILTTLLGGMLPMNIYSAQAFSNEPLCGCLTALTILLCLPLLTRPCQPRSKLYFALLGIVWGLALLAKVTPILLTPLIATAVGIYAFRRESLASGVAKLSLVFATCFLIAGWYYLRNWYWLGKPFVGGWDTTTNNLWWQDPSYRTWDQLASFGQSLRQPIYSAGWSLWDSLYSTLWLDGFTQGVYWKPEAIPYNYPWMQVGAWLGLLPTTLFALGTIAMWQKPLAPARGVLLFAAAAIAIYLAAMVDMFASLPVFSTAKATYLLGLIPCFALMAAAGAGPLLRFRVVRALLLAAVACVASAAYLAYFTIPA